MVTSVGRRGDWRIDRCARRTATCKGTLPTQPHQLPPADKYFGRVCTVAQFSRATKSPALVEMLHSTLWGTLHSELSLEVAEQRLRSNPSAISDLRAVLDYRLKHSPLIASPSSSAYDPLAIHAAYTRDEILVALGHWSFNNRPSQREGVLHLKDRKNRCLLCDAAEVRRRIFADYDVRGLPHLARSVSLAIAKQHVRAIANGTTIHSTQRVGLLHHCCSYGRPRACPRACRHRITSSAHASTSITQAAGRLVSLGN